MFEDFWQKYPKKIARRYAEKCFGRLSTAEQIAAVDGLDKYLKYWKTKGTDSEYIMHASTFINQGRWEDELDLAEKSPSKTKHELFMEKLHTICETGEQIERDITSTSSRLD